MRKNNIQSQAILRLKEILLIDACLNNFLKDKKNRKKEEQHPSKKRKKEWDKKGLDNKILMSLHSEYHMQ